MWLVSANSLLTLRLRPLADVFISTFRVLDHDLLRHLLADRNAGVLHIHDDIAPDSADHCDCPSHDKTEVFQMCLNLKSEEDGLKIKIFNLQKGV